MIEEATDTKRPMPVINPEDLLGRTFINENPNCEGESLLLSELTAKSLMTATAEDPSFENVKFLLSC